MTDAEFSTRVRDRVTVICPESAKIKTAAIDVFVQDAVYEVVKAFTQTDDYVKEHAASYLASHYCAVNLFQNSQAYPEENFGEIDPGTSGTSGTGSIKTNAYKDKRQEFFEKRTSSQGAALVKWIGKVPANMVSLTGTTYGQEYLRLFSQYVATEPFLLGNSPEKELGREPADYPGGRYRRW